MSFGLFGDLDLVSILPIESFHLQIWKIQILKILHFADVKFYIWCNNTPLLQFFPANGKLCTLIQLKSLLDSNHKQRIGGVGEKKIYITEM